MKRSHPDYIPKNLSEYEEGKSKANYGIRSVVFYFVSIGLSVFAFYLLRNVISYDGELSFVGAYLYASAIVGIVSFLCWMASIALAGAGLATNRGSLAGLITVALNFIPAIFILLVILTGWIPDFLIDSFTEITQWNFGADPVDELVIPMDPIPETQE